MKLIKLLSIIFVISIVTGCAAAGKPKTVLIDGITTPEKSAIVHPTAVPGGLMLIRAVDKKSTYIFSIGFLGSIYVPEGEHEFEVEVSHGFSVQDAGGPAWTAPDGVDVAPLQGDIAGSSVLVTKGTSRPKAKIEAGKTYELKFGFTRKDPAKPIPVTWISAIPSA
jgi:hypothetical protein